MIKGETSGKASKLSRALKNIGSTLISYGVVLGDE